MDGKKVPLSIIELKNVTKVKKKVRICKFKTKIVAEVRNHIVNEIQFSTFPTFVSINCTRA